MNYSRPGNRVTQLENAIAWLTVQIGRSGQARRRQLTEQRERLRAALAEAESEAIKRAREHGASQDPWRWARRR